MGALEIALLALALGADCFSVCIGLGMDRAGEPRLFELSALLGLVQSLLFVGGYLAAAALHALLHIVGVFEGILGTWLRSVEPSVVHEGAHLVLSVGGALALAFVGASMIASGAEGAPGVRMHVRKGRIGILLVAATVNVDSITAGVGLGMLDGAHLPKAALLMAVVGGGMAWVGLLAGRRIGVKAGRRAQPVGGAILLLIAAKLLLFDVW